MPINFAKISIAGSVAIVLVTLMRTEHARAQVSPIQSTANVSTLGIWGLSADDWQKLDDNSLFVKAGGAARFPALLEAAKAGDTVAMVLTGVAYEEHSDGVEDGYEADYTESERWYRAAALAGEPRGMVSLASIITAFADESGDDSESTAESVRWNNAAALRGNTNAMSSLGISLVQGRGVSKDDQAAAVWFRRAADAGSVNAMHALSFMLISNKTKPIYEGELEHWVRLSNSSNESSVDFANLGMAFVSVLDMAYSPKESREMARQMAELGTPESMYWLARSLENGQGLENDPAEARGWFQKAAEAGNAEAMVSFAHMLANGRGGMKNEREAIRWYRAAADKGDIWGMIFLGGMLAHPLATEANREESERWFSAAASKADGKNLYYKLILHEEGATITTLNTEIGRFFQQQTETNQSNSFFILGMLQIKGIGTLMNEEAAKLSWRRAAQIGGGAGTNAANALQELYGIICVPRGIGFDCPN